VVKTDAAANAISDMGNDVPYILRSKLSRRPMDLVKRSKQGALRKRVFKPGKLRSSYLLLCEGSTWRFAEKIL